MSLSSSHLITLTTSVTWVARWMSLLMRCERSPSPVMVGAYALWPLASSRSATRRQHQPPWQAPCTSTNVFGAFGAWALVSSAVIMRPPAARAPRTARRECLAARVIRSGRFQQLFREPIRRIDHHVMAGSGDLERLPRRIGFALGQRLVEGRLRILGCSDVGLLRDLVACAGELDRLRWDAVGLRRQLGVDPGAVLLVDMKEFGLRRRPSGLALLQRRAQRIAAVFVDVVEALLAVLRLEGVEPHQRGNALADRFERARGRPAAIGMRDQANASQILPFEHVDDVGDVGVEVDVLVE